MKKRLPNSQAPWWPLRQHNCPSTSDRGRFQVSWRVWLINERCLLRMPVLGLWPTFLHLNQHLIRFHKLSMEYFPLWITELHSTSFINNNSSSSSTLAWKNVNLTRTSLDKVKHVINTLRCSYVAYWPDIQPLLPDYRHSYCHSQVTWPHSCSQNKGMIWCHCFSGFKRWPFIYTVSMNR